MARQKPPHKPKKKGHKPKGKPQGPNRGNPKRDYAPLLTPSTKNGYFLFGRHPIEAALKNPSRICHVLYCTTKAQDIAQELAQHCTTVRTQMVDPDILDEVHTGDSPHQGLLLDVQPLPVETNLHDLAPAAGKNIILMLDQVTDPHNVGACLRSAAALGARALITQDKNSPAESGVLARASSGGLEAIPWVRVPNLSTALTELKDLGYWSVGLAGDTDQSIGGLDLGDNLVLVMGSEGKGLRPLVAKHCDVIAKIPMTDKIESLNVSNAAAIALYELGMR